MPRIIVLALALVAVLALASCTRQEPEVSLEEQVPADQREDEEATDGDAGEQGGDAVAWEAFDLGFEGPTELPAGEVTIRLDNTGNQPHDITVEELDDRTIVETDGGGSDESTVTLEPGTYTFYCSVPGHRGSMEETVEVTG